MITYNYKCKNCAHELETKQKITEEPLKRCPQCNTQMLKRVIQSSKFQLKGEFH